MKNEPRGRVIIINNEIFTHLASRDGTDKDQIALENVFTKLGFTCVVYNNLTEQVFAFIECHYITTLIVTELTGL